MPAFVYTARKFSGERVTGKLDAASRREVLAMLAAQSLFPVEVKSADTLPDIKRVKRVPAQLLATMYSQLADLLHSGVPLLRSLEVLQRQTSHNGLKSVLAQIYRQVEDGATLADAMAKFENIFGEMPISMIRAGGEGGFLEEVLTRVAEFTETQEDLAKRTMGAIAYPVILMTVLFTVVTVLIVFFVPKFEDLFSRLRERGELPIATEWILGLSHVMRKYGIYIAVGSVAGVWLLRNRVRSSRGRLWWDRFKLRIPLIGPIILQLAVARFCRVLGTLLRNGVPILRSLDISSSATANKVLGEAIRKATENISAGEALATPLAASGHFPEAVVEMIAVAEQANNLENVLLSIAESMERRTWRRLELAVRLLEPLLLLILASVVMVVVVALMLPILKMSQAM